MVYSQSGLDRTFHALADPTRRAMLARLARGETAIAELARPFAMSLPAASKHLHVLAEAGLATIRRDGRVRRACLVAAPLRDAAAWVAHYRHFWEQQLDNLAHYLGETTPTTDGEPWLPPSRKTPSALPKTGSRSAAPSRRRPKNSSPPGRRRKR